MGKYIVFEGIDGSGKSTHVKRVVQKLIQVGHMACGTAEPTDGEVGKLVRRILSGELKLDKRVMGMLFVPDTLDHFLGGEGREGLLSLLERDFVVVSDRSYFSTCAYQSAYLPLAWIVKAHSVSMNLLMPDLVVFFDVDPNVCMQRLQARGGDLQIHEKLEFLKGVRERYSMVFKEFPDTRVEYINGGGSEDQVFERVWEVVSQVVEG